MQKICPESCKKHDDGSSNELKAVSASAPAAKKKKKKKAKKADGEGAAKEEL